MTDNLTQNISKELKQIRHKKNMTQVQVAQKAGINVNYYAKLERAESTPSLKTLKKITKALNIKSSKILPF